MRAADTNLFLYAANPASEHHDTANGYFASVQKDSEFVVCELVLVEIYMQLRNPAVMNKPLTSKEAAGFCRTLKNHPTWQHVDYCPEVSDSLWEWAAATTSAFRRVIDARLALTLIYHGVDEFATANTKDFQSFGFQRVWNPLLGVLAYKKSPGFLAWIFVYLLHGTVCCNPTVHFSMTSNGKR